MAEDALRTHGAVHVGLVGLVEPRAHVPGSAFLHVPVDRQLHQPSLRSPVQVGAGMVSGADNIVDLFLPNVGFLAVEPDYRAAYIKFPVALGHGVGQSGSLVDKPICALEIFDYGLYFRPVETARHPRVLIGLRNVGMALAAGRGVNIACASQVLRGEEEWAWDGSACTKWRRSPAELPILWQESTIGVAIAPRPVPRSRILLICCP